MLEILGAVLKGVLGLGNGASVSSSVAGVVNWTLFAPAFLWLYVHRDDVLDIKISFGALAIAALFALFYLEALRRINPQRST